MTLAYYILILVILQAELTKQHLSYPIKYCEMAATCVHDSRAVCGESQDGCSRRSFLDACDMYEYNCDYGMEYTTKTSNSCAGQAHFLC